MELCTHHDKKVESYPLGYRYTVNSVSAILQSRSYSSVLVLYIQLEKETTYMYISILAVALISILRCRHSLLIILKYRGTHLFQKTLSLGQLTLFWLKEVSSFHGLFYVLLYVTGIMHGVLIKADVLISIEGFHCIQFALYVCNLSPHIGLLLTRRHIICCTCKVKYMPNLLLLSGSALFNNSSSKLASSSPYCYYDIKPVELIS